MIVKVNRLCGGPILINTDHVVMVEEHCDRAGNVNGCALQMSKAALGEWNEIDITETRDEFYRMQALETLRAASL